MTQNETIEQTRIRVLRDEAAELDRRADHLDAMMIRSRERLDNVLTSALDHSRSAFLDRLLDEAVQLKSDMHQLNEARVALSNCAYEKRSDAAKIERDVKFAK